MKLIFKQRKFSWLDTYDIFDANGNVIYTIKGQPSFTHTLKVMQNGKEVAKLKERIIALLPRYDMYIDGSYKGYIRKEITLYHPRFQVTYSRWKVKGNFWEMSYRIEDPTNRLIASIHKEAIAISDTYAIEIEDEKDALACVLIVLAVDVERSQRESSKMIPHYKPTK